MPDNANKKSLGIRASVSRWEALKEIALKRRTSVQGLVDGALNRFLPELAAEEPQPEGYEQAINTLRLLADEKPESYHLILDTISKAGQGLRRSARPSRAPGPRKVE